MPGIDPDIWLILGLGATWLLGLIVLLRFTRRPDPEQEHYADDRPRSTNGVPDA